MEGANSDIEPPDRLSTLSDDPKANDNAVRNYGDASYAGIGKRLEQKNGFMQLKEKMKEQFNCSVCDKTFSQKGHLVAHIKNHKTDLYTCSFCDKVFQHKDNLRVHLRIHTGERPYQCPHCVKQFIQKGDLQKHVMIHTGEKPYKCSVCSKGFILKTDLKRHFVTHTGEKPYKCSSCSKSFGYTSMLREHNKLYAYELFHRLGVKSDMGLVHHSSITMQDHDEIGPLDPTILEQFDETEIPHKHVYKLCDTDISQQTTNDIFQWLQTENRLYFCVKCNMRFRNTKLFTNHVKNTHLQGKLLKCDHCGKEFNNSFKLKQHKYSHTGEQPHTCHVCQKGFAQLGNLKQHLKRHTGEKPYVCSTCGGGFSTLPMLKYHHKMHQEACFATNSKSADVLTDREGKYHDCPHCGKQFPHNWRLKRHILIHTGENPYTCIHCDISFKQLSTLKQHQKQHAPSAAENQHPCLYCDKIFPLKISLLGHMKGHKKNPHTCSFCGKIFLRSGHLEAHLTIHTGEKPYLCQYCAKKFSRKEHLQKHIQMHTKPHICRFCNKGFSQAKYLKRHVGSHTGEKTCRSFDSGKKIAQAYHNCGINIPDINRPHKSHLSTSSDQTLDIAFLSNMFAESPVSENLNISPAKDDTKDLIKEPNLSSNEIFDASYMGQDNQIEEGEKEKNILTIPREKHFDCSYCGKKFQQSWLVKRHILSHTGEKPYTCTNCGKSYARSANLKHHWNQCVSGNLAVKKQFDCSVCEKIFSRKVDLVNHMKSHKRDPFTCSFCRKVFQRKDNLQVHLRIHTGEKPYQCPHCVKQFIQKGELQNHVMSHTGEKPYKCSVCSKGFIIKTDLKRHFVTHTGEKPYECSNCGKAFGHASMLREHKKLYADELFHRLGVKSDMGLIHHTSITSSEKTTEQEQDEISLLDLSILEQFDEMEIPHKYIYKLCETEIGQQTIDNVQQWLQTENRLHFCIKCNIRLRDTKLFRNHVKNTHLQGKLHKCDQCAKEFLTAFKLKQHRYSHTGERAHTCHVCRKGFTQSGSLTKHLRTHRGEKPLLCSICGIGFSRLSMLKNHQKMHEKSRYATNNQSAKDVQECSESTLNSEQTQTVDSRIPNECIRSSIMKKLDEKGSKNSLNCRKLLSQRNSTSMDKMYSCICCWLCVHGFSSANALQEHLALHKVLK